MSSIINVNELESKNGILYVGDDIVLNFQNVDSFLEMPSGSSAQRPSNPSSGAFRWNTDLNNAEVYDGYTWRSFKKVNDYQIAITGAIATLDTANPTSYPGSGSNWYNYETYENRLSLINSPSFSSTNRGFLNFNGSNQYGTFYRPSSKLYPINSITQECWFKTNNSGTAQNLIGLQYGISTNASYKLYLTSTSWAGGVNIGGTFQEISIPYTSFPLDSNTWYQFCHTFTGSSFNINLSGNITNGSNIITNVSSTQDIASGYSIVGTGIPSGATVVSKTQNTITISSPATSTFTNISIRITVPAGQRLYINGQVVASTSISGIIEYNTNNKEVTVGTMNKGSGTDTGKTDYLNGSISVVRLYSKSLKEGQILTNFNSLRQRYGL